MKRPQLPAFLLAPIVVAAALQSFASAAPIPAAKLAALQKLVQPDASEIEWRTRIPWRTSLWAARREAAATGKPIYLWEMDGHPLGCT